MVGETKDLTCNSNSLYTNREIESDTFLLVAFLSLEGTKGTEVTQLDFQH